MILSNLTHYHAINFASALMDRSVAYLAKVFLRFPFAYKLVGRLVGRGLSTFLFLR